MRLLLTGATGFVGRNCLLQAAPHYEKIFAVVRSEEKLRAQGKEDGLGLPLFLHPLDIEPEKWSAVDPDHAILSAGVLFARNRDEYFATNVDWALRVIKALPPGCRIVILSSQSAGGPTPPGQESRSESDADHPITWYGESKLAMEKAVRAAFPDRAITILRPPMVLGPRDLATLPLFQMVQRIVRFKPGLRAKHFSFIAVEDLARAIFSVLNQSLASPESHYVASSEVITDWQLIQQAAMTTKRRGLTLPLPQPAMRLLAAAVDAIPPLRQGIPSLTRDRAKEIWPDRWVVNAGRFENLSGWKARQDLAATMQAACESYVRRGLLR